MTRKLNSAKDNTFVPTIAYKQSPLTTTLFLEKVTIQLTRTSPQALVILVRLTFVKAIMNYLLLSVVIMGIIVSIVSS